VVFVSVKIKKTERYIVCSKVDRFLYLVTAMLKTKSTAEDNGRMGGEDGGQIQVTNDMRDQEEDM
jgi:hypothetical protein